MKIHQAWLLTLIVGGSQALGQSVQNIKAAVGGERITVTYDIVGANSGQTFTIQLYSSHNSYGSPLAMVVGDVGEKVTPGAGKKIEWFAKAELGAYKGDLTFEVRGNLHSTFQVVSPGTGYSAKKGSKISIEWKGGNLNDKIRIELVHGGATVETISDVANNGTYTWVLPASATPGSDYQIKVGTTKESGMSSPFVVKRKMPIWMLAIPVAAAGAVVALLGGGGGDETNPPSSDLPTPPDPD